MDKIEVILKALDANGLGNTKRINDEILSLYPLPLRFENDNDYYYYTRRIEVFLTELQDQGLIKFQIEGLWGVKSCGRYMLFDDCSIFASITYKGLKDLEQPVPAQTNYSATFNAPFTGNFNQGGSTALSQSTNEESSESKELAKATLMDLPRNKWYRRWSFILTVIGILVTIIIYLVSSKSS